MQTFFSVVLLISAVVLIISVLMQEGSGGGIGAIGGGGGESGALWGKNRGTSKEVILQRVTIVAAVLFMISAIALAAK